MIVLVDYSWLRYRSLYAFSKLIVNKKGVIYNTGVIFGIYQVVERVFRIYPDAEVYFVLDGIPEKQVKEQSTYKASRDDDESITNLNIPYTLLAHQYLVIPKLKISYHPTMEADESIAVLLEMLPKKEDQKTVIMSTDFDLRQLVNDKNNIYCSKYIDEKEGFDLEDEEAVIKIDGVKAEGIALYKAICGDKSDEVYGIPYFTKSLAKGLSNELKTAENLEKFLDNPRRGLSRHNKAYNTLKDNINLIKSNYHITKIDPDYVPDIIEDSSLIQDDFMSYYEAVKTKEGIDRIIESQT